jgi:hypothetical protein
MCALFAEMDPMSTTDVTVRERRRAGLLTIALGVAALALAAATTVGVFLIYSGGDNTAPTGTLKTVFAFALPAAAAASAGAAIGQGARHFRDSRADLDLAGKLVCAAVAFSCLTVAYASVAAPA